MTSSSIRPNSEVATFPTYSAMSSLGEADEKYIIVNLSTRIALRKLRLSLASFPADSTPLKKIKVCIQQCSWMIINQLNTICIIVMWYLLHVASEAGYWVSLFNWYIRFSTLCTFAFSSLGEGVPPLMTLQWIRREVSTLQRYLAQLKVYERVYHPFYLNFKQFERDCTVK